MAYTINDKTKKITLVRGDTLRIQVEVLVDGEVYTPVNGDIIRFYMKQSYNSTKLLISKGISIINMTLKLDPSDTKKLAFGNYVYDIEITFANGDVDTFIRGELELLPEVN